MKRITILAALLWTAMTAFSQNTDEASIKKCIQDETDAYKNRNLEGMGATWKHEDNASFTYLSRYAYFRAQGWDSLHSTMAQDMKQNLPQNDPAIGFENYTIRTNGNMAFVEYDRVLTPVNDQSNQFPYTGVSRYHVYRTMEKENDQWKTISVVNTEPETYNTANDPHRLEFDINLIGYELLAAKKYNEAIEEFKMNVKLFPNSFNVYDSLGEAYADAGNTKLAIENYQKSVDLNPNNDNGKQWLTKLKAK